MIGPERGDAARKVARMLDDIAWAEGAGLDTAWIPQIPGDFDALVAIALMGATLPTTVPRPTWAYMPNSVPGKNAGPLPLNGHKCGNRYLIYLANFHYHKCMRTIAKAAARSLVLLGAVLALA